MMNSAASAAAVAFLGCSVGLAEPCRAVEGFASQIVGLSSTEEHPLGLVAVLHQVYGALDNRVLVVRPKPFVVVDVIVSRDGDWIEGLLAAGDLDGDQRDDLVVRYHRGVAVFGTAADGELEEKLFLPKPNALLACVLHTSRGREIALCRLLAADGSEAEPGAVFHTDEMNRFTIEFFDERGGRVRESIRVDTRSVPGMAAHTDWNRDDLLFTRAYEDGSGTCWMTLELASTGEVRTDRLDDLPFGLFCDPPQVVRMNDVDGDGWAEVALIYVPLWEGFFPAGEVRGNVVCMAKGALAPLKAKVLGDGANVGDLDGDGMDDLVIAGHAGAYSSVVAMSGKDGSQLFATTIEEPECVGSGIARMGDYDGDGIGDVIVSSGDLRCDGKGALYVISGQSGKVFERWRPRDL